jgi:5-carboxymethyl-2-hydroxymuconate isomerase
MPHIHLETTADLEENANVPDILEALTEELSSYETIPSKGVKAVHSLRSVWCIGEGGPAGFAHCEVAILQGRPLELRQAIANSMMEILRAQFSESVESGAATITLELREMEKDTYRK